TVEGAVITVPIVELAQSAQIAAEPFGRHRGVLPAFPVVLAVPRARGRAQPRLPHFPETLRRFAVLAELHRDLAAQLLHQRACLLFGLALRLAAEFDQQPAFS